LVVVFLQGARLTWNSVKSIFGSVP
jgi:hypothetical protein